MEQQIKVKPVPMNSEKMMWVSASTDLVEVRVAHTPHERGITVLVSKDALLEAINRTAPTFEQRIVAAKKGAVLQSIKYPIVTLVKQDADQWYSIITVTTYTDAQVLERVTEEDWRLFNDKDD